MTAPSPELATRLRRIARGYEADDYGVAVNLDEAAAEIDRLTAKVATLRETCAELCEEIQRRAYTSERSPYAEGFATGANECVEAIRAARDLREENARLRHDIDRAITNHSADLTSEAALITENARLREALEKIADGKFGDDAIAIENFARAALPKEPT